VKRAAVALCEHTALALDRAAGVSRLAHRWVGRGACDTSLIEWRSDEEVAMPDTILDGSGEQVPGHRHLEGTDLEIAYALLGDDLVLRVNKAGVQVFGVVLENAAKTMTTQQLLEFRAEKSDLVIRLGTRRETVADIGYRLGRVANKLIKATREKIDKA